MWENAPMLSGGRDLKTNMLNESKPNKAGFNGERCPTGIPGLDDILAGGIQPNCFYLVQGYPGSGKTTLALQFLLEGLRLGDSGFYVPLSETKQELDIVAKSHGWSLDDITLLELSAIEAFGRKLFHLVTAANAPIDLSYLCDTVINLRYFEA